MVKRDSKDRIKSPNSCSEDVPSLLPRGKNGNNNILYTSTPLLMLIVRMSQWPGSKGRGPMMSQY